MKLTDKQRKAIQQMDTEMCIDTMHECAGRLGLITVGEYHDYTKIPKRTIYDHIENGKIMAEDFCGSKLIIMNDTINGIPKK